MAGTPVSVTGARRTDTILQARRVVDMADKIVMLEDDKKALMTFVSSLGTRPVYNPEFHWLRDEIIPKTGRLGAAHAGGTANGTNAVFNLAGLGTGIYLKKDDLVKFPLTGMIGRVIDTPTDMTLVTLQVGVGDLIGVTAAIALNGTWTKVGNAREENSTLRDGLGSFSASALSTLEVDEFNYTQTFRDAVALSRRENDTKLYGGPDRPFQRMKKLLEHCESINNAMWHGKKAPLLAGGPAGVGAGGRTYMGGMIQAIENFNAGANVLGVLGAPLSPAVLDDFSRGITRYGNSEKRVLFCSRYAKNSLSKATRNDWRVNDPKGSIKWGVEVISYQTGYGATLDVVTDHALEDVPGQKLGVSIGAPAPYDQSFDGYAVLIDPEHVKKAIFGGTDTQLQVEVQLPDQDGLVDAYISDVGLQYGHPGHHGLIKGIK